MKKILSLVSAFVLATCSLSSFAEGRTAEEIYKQCGLGGALFGSSSPLLAMISNITWDLGTTAASSEMSDACSVDSAEVAAAIYIHEAYDLVETDISKGSGEYLDALTSVLSCETKSVDQLIGEIRADFADVIDASDYAGLEKSAKANALYEVVKPHLNSAASASCTLS